MADYTVTTDFPAKDAAQAVVLGSEHSTEFTNIQAAISTKANKVLTPIAGNFVEQDASGDIVPSSIPITPVGRIIDVQVFTASGTWNKPSGTVSIEVVAIGGGGVGGTAVASSFAGNVGGGGASGSCAWVRFLTGFGSSQIVTIGAGGTVPGADGGDTTFGSLITAYGGEAGSNAIGSGLQVVAPGGAVSLTPIASPNEESILLPSQEGQDGYTYNTVLPVAFEAKGGAPIFPFGLSAGVNVSVGSRTSPTPPTGYGAGGNGCAIAGFDALSGTGGVGSDGIVIVYSYS